MLAQTERLILRQARIEDADAAAQLWSSPEVMRFMGGPRDPEKIRQYIIDAAQAGEQITYDFWWAVVERESERVLGDCGLIVKEVEGVQEVEIVYLLLPEAWRKGYATEAACAIRDHAFSQLGLSRLIALIDPENTPSERVAVRLGMQVEKEVIRPNGRRMILYSLEH